MRTVNVNRNDLLSVLKKNREQHLQEYLEARAGYQVKAIKQMKQNLKQARQGGEIIQHLGLVVPLNYTDHYDIVIGMLEMDVNPHVELTQDDYNRYVMDNWDWKGSAMMANSHYSATLSGKSR